MRTKVCKDGFVWLEMTKDEAKGMFLRGVELFKLYDDESEGLVETAAEFYRHKGMFGIEIGNIKDLFNEYLLLNDIKTGTL